MVASKEDDLEKNEVIIKPTILDLMEIKERKMQMRENEICRKEISVKEKKQKLKEVEENERILMKALDQQFENREHFIIVKQNKLEADLKEMNENLAYLAKNEFHHEREETLKRKEFELTDKNAVLEITLKMHEQSERLAIQLKDHETNLINEDKKLNKLLDAREQTVLRQQQKLDERELHLEEKKMIIDIAFRLNDYR